MPVTPLWLYLTLRAFERMKFILSLPVVKSSEGKVFVSLVESAIGNAPRIGFTADHRGFGSSDAKGALSNGLIKRRPAALAPERLPRLGRNGARLRLTNG